MMGELAALPTPAISAQLVHRILADYAQPWHGLHGPAHWARVLENGLRLAGVTCANVAVVQLFAVFHDARRVTESVDRQHGQRGAEYAASLRGVLYDLPDEAFELLYAACAYHTDGLTQADVTVQTCWDADRLDLARAGIRLRPERLCTQAARCPDVMEWATQRSLECCVPDRLYAEWGVAMGALDPEVKSERGPG